MTIFKQGNYPKDYLGNSGISLAKAGCTTCSITVGCNAILGTNYTPVQVSKKIKYTPQGLVEWSSLKNIGLKLDLLSRVRNDKAVDEALASPNKFAILEITHGGHFVLAWGRKTSQGYKMYDPYYGDINYTDKRKYNLTGCRIISKLK